MLFLITLFEYNTIILNLYILKQTNKHNSAIKNRRVNYKETSHFYFKITKWPSYFCLDNRQYLWVIFFIEYAKLFNIFYFSFQRYVSQLLCMMYLVGILRPAWLMFIIFGCFVFFLDLSSHWRPCQEEKGKNRIWSSFSNV